MSRSSKARRNQKRKQTKSAENEVEPKGTPEDRAQAPFNTMGTGRSRDVTMWERDEREREALERLRRLNQGEY